MAQNIKFWKAARVAVSPTTRPSANGYARFGMLLDAEARDAAEGVL
jgi:hypothetical protein